ncbi:MAG TPA: protein translocase subunit SecD [Candidatus Acidoferrum sp.]|nr:protein translocase subunit SecD [Candidatus Acidoferrum sp.]
MNPNLKWKAAFIVIVILICIYGLIGMPVFPTSLAQIKDNFARQIKLGLDLQGGTHLILQVQVEEAVARETDDTIDGLTSQLAEKNIHTDEIRRVDDTHILVRNVDPSQYSNFSDLVTRRYGNDWNMTTAAGEQNSFLLTLKPSSIAQIQLTTMDQSVETIARRINALGLTEPTIQLHGRNDNEILVQLPGEGDPARAKAVIQAGGQLELTLVRGGPFTTQAEALASTGGVLPAGTELIPGRNEAPEGSSANTGEIWYLVDRTPVVTGRDLKPDGVREEPSARNPGQWQVNFTLSTEAARRFGPFTEANMHKQMAIVLDHSVYSAPVINGRIEDQGMIEGNFTKQSAHDLALVLRAGALPASIKYLYEGTVGPSLGADSIRHGVQASVLSLIVVLLFLLFYYRLSGANAVLALLLNLIILMAFLALSGAVLTLPGIAGVILTIGMGVDSNVLVFERIREELRYGKSAASAVDAGFEKAFLTIIDTHVTTVVSAFFLFVFGTGPIRGFAITLVVGLVANLFTSIYVSKTIFQYHLAKMDRQAELSI